MRGAGSKGLAREAMQGDLRALPSVERLLQTEPLRSAASAAPRALAVEAARRELERCRAAILAGNGGPPGPEEIAARAAGELRRAERASLGPVINATGVVIHTNLGRAPLAFEALEAIDSAASGYSNLEYDFETRDAWQPPGSPRAAGVRADRRRRRRWSSTTTRPACCSRWPPRRAGARW